MSLRRRLVVVLVLGLGALVIAVVAIARVLAGTDAARERTAATNTEAGAQALADALAGHIDGSKITDPIDGDLRVSLQVTAGSLLRAVPSAAGGYCTTTGMIVASAGKAGIAPGDRGHGRDTRPHALLPDLAAMVSAACERAKADAPVHMRLERARDVNLVTVVSVGKTGGAWFLTQVRLRSSDDSSPWPIEVILLALAAAALAAVTIDAMVALGRGADALRGSLRRLEGDLRAPVPRPRAEELGQIAAGLEEMASHLADARERERALEQTLARDQRLAALGRVAAGVAHEVRNPLAGMKLRLDLLKQVDALDGESREDVAACLGEIARLDRLVVSLLSVSRSKTKALEKVDLGALCDARAAAARPTAGGRATVTRVGEGEAMADPDALAGALDNLLRNALEASPPGGSVTLRIHEAQGRMVLDVEDAGPGVPESRRGELFEPFFTTKAEGTGLGLWISRMSLEAAGATLRYEREGAITRMRIAFEETAPPRP